MDTEKKGTLRDTIVEKDAKVPRSPEQEPQPEVKEPPRPGEIPEPPEKAWDAEPSDPYEGIDRSDPFEGRPKTAVPQPAEVAGEHLDHGPGQPLPPNDDDRK